MAHIKTIIKKNLDLIFSSRKSFFFIFLVPSILFFIIGGVFYTNSTYTIKIGVVNEDNNSLINDYSQNFENQGFTILNYTQKNECISSIENEISQMCLVFNQTQNSISQIESLNLNLYVDNTKKELTEIGKNIFSNVVDIKTQKLKDEYTKQIFEIFTLIRNNSVQQKGLVENISNVVKSFESEISQNEGDIKATLKQESSKILTLKKDVDEYILARKTLVDFIENELEDIGNKLNDTVEDLENETGYSDVKSIRSSFQDVSSDISFLKSEMPEYKSLINKLENISRNLDSDNTKDTSSLFKGLNELNDISKQRVNDVLLTVSKIENISRSLPKESLMALANPISLEVFDVYSVNIDSENSQITSNLHVILSIVISLLATILASTFIYSERNNDAYLRNMMSTISAFKFTFGNFISLFIILYLQIFICIFLFNMFYMKLWNSNFGYILILLVFVVACFTLIGIFIGLVSNNLNTNFMLNFFILFLMFIFSGSVVPLEFFSQKIIEVLYSLNPYLVSQEIIRKILLSEISYLVFFDLVLILIEWIFFLFLVCLILQSFDMKKLAFFLFSRFLVKLKRYAIKIPFGKYMSYFIEYIEKKFRI